MFGSNRKNRIKIYISLIPRNKGGGANTFANNFVNWVRDNRDKYVLVKNIFKADKAIVLANKAEISSVSKAREKGCFIIHRLDEYFEQNESEYRREKHQSIIDLNKFADVTVYQSRFVCDNVQPYLQTQRYVIIINGPDPKLFYPAKQSGEYIGHVSWSSDERKRYNLLYNLIEHNPRERFLLIGRHNKTLFPFEKFENVILAGAVNRNRIRDYYHKMKMLFLPSEKDPCPNTAVEAILCGVPVCYNPDAGTKEIVRDCGVPLDRFREILDDTEFFRNRCLSRKDLCFDPVAGKYMSLE